MSSHSPLDTSKVSPTSGVPLIIGTLTFTGGSVSGNLWSLQLLAGDALADGTYEVVATATDAYGNATVPVLDTGLSFTVDPVVPALVGQPILSGDGIYRAGEVVEVVLQLDDALGGNLPAATLRSQPAIALPCSEDAVIQGLWRCSGPALDGTETEGDVRVDLTWEDASGNAGAAEAVATLDFSAPTLVSTQVLPTIARAGDL